MKFLKKKLIYNVRKQVSVCLGLTSGKTGIKRDRTELLGVVWWWLYSCIRIFVKMYITVYFKWVRLFYVNYTSIMLNKKDYIRALKPALIYV